MQSDTATRLRLAILFALILTGCGQRKPTRFEALYGGVGGPELLQNATNAEAYRVTRAPTTGPRSSSEGAS